MNNPIHNNGVKPVLGKGKIAFITILFVAGFILLAWTAARAFNPPPPKSSIAQEAKDFLRTKKAAAPLGTPRKTLERSGNLSCQNPRASFCSDELLQSSSCRIVFWRPAFERTGRSRARCADILLRLPLQSLRQPAI